MINMSKTDVRNKERAHSIYTQQCSSYHISVDVKIQKTILKL